MYIYVQIFDFGNFLFGTIQGHTWLTGLTCVTCHVPGRHQSKHSHQPCRSWPRQSFIQKKKKLVKGKNPENPPRAPSAFTPRKPRVHHCRFVALSSPTTGRPPPHPYGRCPGPGDLPATSSHQVSARHPFSSLSTVRNRAPEP